MVEEAAAASKAMQNQAHSLDELITFFSIKGQARKVVKKQVNEVAPLARHQPALQTAAARSLTQSSSEEWQDF